MVLQPERKDICMNYVSDKSGTEEKKTANAPEIEKLVSPVEEQGGSLLPPLGFRTSLHILSNRFLLLLIKQIVVSLMELHEMIQVLIFTLKLLSLLQAVNLNYCAISRCIWQQSVLCDDIS